MLCQSLMQRLQVCTKSTAGISDVSFFDPEDLNFIQATTNGVVGPYTAITRRTGATGQLVFPLTFNYEEGEAAVDQSLTNGSSDYKHKFTFQVLKRNQSLTNFLQSIDATIACCGLGVFIRYNSGETFVAGERYVNGSAITKFLMRQNGSSGSSGKTRTDLNGYNLVIEGSYDRDLYEFSGLYSVLEAFMVSTPATPVTYGNVIAFNTDASGVATTGAKNGLTFTAAAINANQKVEYDTVTPATGGPVQINIKENNVAKITIGAFGDLITSGNSFRYIDTAGNPHTQPWAATINITI